MLLGNIAVFQVLFTVGGFCFCLLYDHAPSILRNILQGMRICTIMQLGEATPSTHQTLSVTWAKELLSMNGLFISILYPIMLKVPCL